MPARELVIMNGGGVLDIIVGCYINNDFSPIKDYLADDCVYRSQWVFGELRGKKKIADYLTRKSEAFAKNKALCKAWKIKVISPFPQNAILVSQSERNKCVVLLIGIEEQKIKSFDLCSPDMFRYEYATAEIE